jgi:hypothetical protein
MTSPIASIKAQGPHVPTLVLAVGAFLVVLFVYHLAHRRR